MRARIPRILGCGGKNHTGAATAQACVSMGDRGGGMAVPLRMIAGVLIMIAVLSTAAPVRVAAQQPYILAAEDVIEVVVFGNADVSRTVTIRPDGMISLPLIGEVAAAGLSPERLRRQLTQLFTTYFRTPQVAVIVREFHKVRVAVLGEVARPGIFPLRGSLTALQALTLAGGPTRRALLNRAHVIRRDRPPGRPAAEVTLATVVVAKQSAAGIQLIPVDLLKVIREGDIARDAALQRGDVLYIPENPIALENIALLIGVAANVTYVLR